MPFVTLLRCAPADLVGKVTAKRPGPAPHGLVADDDPADGRTIRDHSLAERTAKLQPERWCDDLSRTAVASMAGVSNVIHHTAIPRNALHPVKVTGPFCPLYVSQNRMEPNLSARTSIWQGPAIGSSPQRAPVVMN